MCGHRYVSEDQMPTLSYTTTAIIGVTSCCALTTMTDSVLSEVESKQIITPTPGIEL